MSETLDPSSRSAGQPPLEGEWLYEACVLLARVPALMRVTIAQVRGSSPRETGTTMLVTSDGQHGTIGGGRLEWLAVQQSRRLLTDNTAPVLWRELRRLGPDLAQCCGGELWLEFERIPQASLPALQSRRDAWRPAPRPALWIFGAGHVGAAVVRLLKDLPLFDVQWIDSREGLPPPAGSPHVISSHAPDPGQLVATARPGTSYLVLTHDHELDYRLCTAILARGDAAWTGLIGSKSKAARFRSRLRRDGFSADAIAALTCPVGHTAITSKLPAAIAVGIVAQLLALPPLAQQQPLPWSRPALPVSPASLRAPAHLCDLDCAHCQASAAMRSASALHGISP